MPKRLVDVPRIGEVLLSKRRGAKHLRLSISASGQVRVSLPAWAPYTTGIAFAKSRESWIVEQLQLHGNQPIDNQALIGRSHRVMFIRLFNGEGVKIRIKAHTIEVSSSLPIEDQLVQKKLVAACEKVLRAQADQQLSERLELLAKRYGFSYKSVRIRKLVSRWGSCSKDRTITLSYYLVQLPQELIDYVLLHELNHTKHLHHGPEFWTALKRILPDAKALQTQIRAHKPRIQPL